MIRFLHTIVLICFCSCLYAQTVEGVWETFDNKRNKPMSHIQIYKQNGKLYGKIVKVLYNDENYTTCTKCSGEDKNKPLMNMMVIRGLEYKSGKWEKDDGILDPMSGLLLDGAIWLDSPNKLKVKGSWGFLSDTQTWTRVK